MKYVTLILLFLLSSYFTPEKIFAGGGRFELQSQYDFPIVGKTDQVIGTILHAGNPSDSIAGEHIQIFIDNARQGDSCVLRNTASDQDGHITADCIAQTPGQMSIYLHSLDKGDDSSKLILNFVSPPPDPTATPLPYTVVVSTETPTETLSPTHPISNTISPTVFLTAPLLQVSLTLTPTTFPSLTPTPQKKQSLIVGINNTTTYAFVLLLLIVVIGAIVYIQRNRLKLIMSKNANFVDQADRKITADSSPTAEKLL